MCLHVHVLCACEGAPLGVYVFILACIHAFVRARVFESVCTSVRVCMCVHLVCMCACLHARVHACEYVCF